MSALNPGGGTPGTKWDFAQTVPPSGASAGAGRGGTGRDRPPIGASHRPTPPADPASQARNPGQSSLSGSFLPAGERWDESPPRGASPSASPVAASGSFFVFESEAEALAFEERAAIRQFDGGLSRAAAERLAALDIINSRAASSPSHVIR